MIENLPNEMFFEIFKFLGAKDILNCTSVSCEFQEQANSKLLWELLHIRTFRREKFIEESDNISWKESYKSYYRKLKSLHHHGYQVYGAGLDEYTNEYVFLKFSEETHYLYFDYYLCFDDYCTTEITEYQGIAKVVPDYDKHIKTIKRFWKQRSNTKPVANLSLHKWINEKETKYEIQGEYVTINTYGMIGEKFDYFHELKFAGIKGSKKELKQM